MSNLFNQATNLREDNQGTRGKQIYEYMTQGFDGACAMPFGYLQGNRVKNNMPPVIDIETSLRQAPYVDYINNSRSDAPKVAIPQKGIEVPDCKVQMTSGFIKRRLTDREMPAPELVLRTASLQSGVMQLGEDTRTTFKFSTTGTGTGSASGSGAASIPSALVPPPLPAITPAPMAGVPNSGGETFLAALQRFNKSYLW